MTIINRAISMYIDGDVGEVNVVYKKLISALKNEVIIEKLLPLNFNDEAIDGKKNDGKAIDSKDYVDIDAIDETAMGELTSLFLSGKVMNSMLHSRASEHRARMESMGSATNNANDILDKLKFKL